MEHVAKICAKSLRVYFIDNHGIELKSAHSYELVAACFGYKTYAALRKDKIAHINNLPQSEIVVMSPGNLIDRRCKKLQAFPLELSDSYALGEAIYAPLFLDKWWKSLYPPFRSFEKLAKFIVENNDSFKHVFKFHKSLPMEHIFNEKVVENGMLLTVWHCHKIPTGELVADGITTIKLPRVAGYIGYGRPQVFVTLLTGQARQIFRENLKKHL